MIMQPLFESFEQHQHAAQQHAAQQHAAHQHAAALKFESSEQTLFDAALQCLQNTIQTNNTSTSISISLTNRCFFRLLTDSLTPHKHRTLQQTVRLPSPTAAC